MHCPHGLSGPKTALANLFQHGTAGAWSCLSWSHSVDRFSALKILGAKDESALQSRGHNLQTELRGSGHRTEAHYYWRTQWKHCQSACCVHLPFRAQLPLKLMTLLSANESSLSMLRKPSVSLLTSHQRQCSWHQQWRCEDRHNGLSQQ